jgi:cobalt-zinc-cadmium efflux system protein
VPHHHTHAIAAPTRRLTAALALIVAFMAAEIVVAIVSHSLALLSDAGHMLADAGALALALVAAQLAKRPAKGAMTYGLRRVEILSAQANGVTLLILAAFVVYAAIRRLVHQPAVHAWPVLGVALAGVAVNLAATIVLAGADRRSLNVEGSFRHILTDLYAFIGTAVAAGVILATGFARADAIASLFVALLMAHAGYRLLMASGRIFLEAAPEGIDPDAVGVALASVTGIVEVHDLHVWEVTSGFPALSAHVLVAEGADCHAARAQLATLLRERYGIAHSTLQVEHEHEQLLAIEGSAPPAR